MPPREQILPNENVHFRLPSVAQKRCMLKLPTGVDKATYRRAVRAGQEISWTCLYRKKGDASAHMLLAQ